MLACSSGWEASKGAVPKSIMLRLVDTHARLDELEALHIALREVSAIGSGHSYRWLWR